MFPVRHHPPALRAALAPLLSLLLALALVPGVSAHEGVDGAAFAVTHGPVTTSLVGETSDGHELGDLRVTSLPIDWEEDGAPAGRLDAMLLTTSVDSPIVGDETRISTLVFVFGDGADQLVVTGSGFYPAAGSTIAVSASIERAIVGGSGVYAGASGWALSEHRDDGSWRHVFHLASSEPSMKGAGSDATGGIVRTLLGDVEPATAQDRTLALWHYTIPVGQALVPHVHPGYQVARIVSGTLTYDVIAGEALVVRGDGTRDIVGAGEVVTLEAGDTVVENPDVSHFGSNQGDVPVELYSASLFATGAPPAEPLASPAP
jgi:quercetin dioxygenase-like cupin family protein